MHRSWWPYGSALHVVVQATLLVWVWSFTTGCGRADPGPRSEVTDSPRSGEDAGLQHDPDSGADAADAAEDSSSSGPCEGAHEDLGVLSTAEPTVVSRTLQSARGAPTSCAPSGQNRGEYIFAFEADTLAILEVSVSATTTDPISFGLYEESCDTNAELYCSQQSPWRAIVEPDKTYYLNVQAGEDTPTNTFNVSFSFEDAACVPGEASCTDGAVEHCQQGTEVDTYSCAQDCSAQDDCTGDTCEAALTVEPTVGDTPVTLRGDRRAYTHQWNAADLSDCEASESLENGDTTAMEVFARVPNLLAGQTLTVGDASGSGSYLYYVIDDCAATSCRQAMFIDDNGDNRLAWDVPEDGDYIVVIEALSSTSRPFQFEFALQ